MYVIVVLDFKSDATGIDAVFGPFETWEDANEQRARAARLTQADTDAAVQVARIETIRDPL